MPRKGLEKKTHKFNLSEECIRELSKRADKRGVDEMQGDTYTYHPKAFGTSKKNTLRRMDWKYKESQKDNPLACGQTQKERDCC